MAKHNAFGPGEDSDQSGNPSSLNSKNHNGPG